MEIQMTQRSESILASNISKEAYNSSKRGNHEWRNRISAGTSLDAKKAKIQELESKKTKKYSTFKKLYLMTTHILDHTLFDGIPPFFPLKKKLNMVRYSSYFFNIFDVLILVGSILLCANYIAESYSASYEAVQYYNLVEKIITMFFIFDVIVARIVFDGDTLGFLLKPSTIIDLLIIIPSMLDFVRLEDQQSANILNTFQLFRFLRIMKIAEIMEAFASFERVSEVSKRLLHLFLTILCIVFISAGVFQVLENDVKQLLEYNCLYSNAATNWQPSCSPTAPFDASKPGDCDCNDYNCVSFYSTWDSKGKPSMVLCPQYTYLDCLYYLMVTLSTVGYGDIAPTYNLSRAMVIVLLIVIIVVLPEQVNKMSSIVAAASSPYVKKYKPAMSHIHHVILWGNVNNKNKLDRFFREFFNEARIGFSGREYYAVAFSEEEPCNEVRSYLMFSQAKEKLTYIVGSVTNVDDMRRIKADKATAIFFLCNETNKIPNLIVENDKLTVAQCLGVQAYDRNLEIVAQLSSHESREALIYNHVDVILSYDHYTASVAAKNAMCPGFAPFLQNMIQSVQTFDDDQNKVWENEYLKGCDKEFYYVHIPKGWFLEDFDYSFNLIAEGIYLKYQTICVGVCNEELTDLVLNPTIVEMEKQYPKESGSSLKQKFYEKYNMLIVIADDPQEAYKIGSVDIVEGNVDEIVSCMYTEELLDGVCEFPSKSQTKWDEENRDVKLQLLRERAAITNKRWKEAMTETSSIRKKYGAIKDRTNNDNDDLKEIAIPLKTTLKDITDHILLVGVMSELHLMLREFRRPTMGEENMNKPIVVVCDTSRVSLPTIRIRESEHVLLSNVYAIHGDFEDRTEFSKLNIDKAHSINILTTQFAQNTSQSYYSCDVDIIFLYLSFMQRIPSCVFLSAQVENAYDVSLLNRKASEHYIRYHHTAYAEMRSTMDFNTKDDVDSMDDPSFVYRSDIDPNEEIYIMKSQSNIDRWNQISKNQNLSQKLKSYWDIRNTETALPIYAAGKVYTTGAFDALTIQCFYSSIFAKLIDAIVRGQSYQSMIQLNVPLRFVSRTFTSLFRHMLAYHILVVGLYREVTDENGATFSYTQTSPPQETIINEGDKMFIYCNADAAILILKGEQFTRQEGTITSSKTISSNNPLHS